jgi:hypothetical protein
VFALIVCVVICFDWSSSWLAQRSLGDVIYNPRPPSLLLLFIFIFGFPLIILRSGGRFSDRLGIIGAAMCCGGSMANFISRIAFGPVPDFIPISFLATRYECDPADLAIWSGALVVIVALAISAREQYLSKRTLTLAPTQALPVASPPDWGF